MVFQNGNLREQNDPLYQVNTLKTTDLHVYIDNGDMDHKWLIEGNQTLFESLRKKNINVNYEVHYSGHDYKYWSSQTEQYLKIYGGSGL